MNTPKVHKSIETSSLFNVEDYRAVEPFGQFVQVNARVEWAQQGNTYIHTRTLHLFRKVDEICEYLCGVIVFLWCSVRPNEISSETTCKVRPHNQFFFHFCCECLCVKRSIPSYHYEFALHFNMRFYGSLI